MSDMFLACVILLDLEHLTMLPCPIWYGQVLA
jgi:hypothetical protein